MPSPNSIEAQSRKFFADMQQTVHCEREEAGIRVNSRRATSPLSDYADLPAILAGGFPTLFRFGARGFKLMRDSRELFTYYDGRFARNPQLVGLLACTRRRHKLHASSARRVKYAKEQWATFVEIISRPDFDDSLARAVADPTTEEALALMKTLAPLVSSVSGAALRSDAERSRVEGELYSFVRFFGMPSSYLSAAPNDAVNLTAIRLSTRPVDNESWPVTTSTADLTATEILDGLRGYSLAGGGETAAQRANRAHRVREGIKRHTGCEVPLTRAEMNLWAGKNPISSVIAFKAVVDAVFTRLFGMKPTRLTTSSPKPCQGVDKGAFGTPVAFLYVEEENGRQALHIHALMWAGMLPDLLANAAGLDAVQLEDGTLVDLEQEVLDALDTQYKREVGVGLHVLEVMRSSTRPRGLKLRPSLDAPLIELQPGDAAFVQARAEVNAKGTNDHSHCLSCGPKGSKKGQFGCRYGLPGPHPVATTWFLQLHVPASRSDPVRGTAEYRESAAELQDLRCHFCQPHVDLRRDRQLDFGVKERLDHPGEDQDQRAVLVEMRCRPTVPGLEPVTGAGVRPGGAEAAALRLPDLPPDGQRALQALCDVRTRALASGANKLKRDPEEAVRAAIADASDKLEWLECIVDTYTESACTCLRDEQYAAVHPETLASVKKLLKLLRADCEGEAAPEQVGPSDSDGGLRAGGTTQADREAAKAEAWKSVTRMLVGFSKLQCANARIASYNPVVTYCVGSNTKIDPLGCGLGARSVLHYLVKYLTKKQATLYVSASVLAQGWKRVQDHPSVADDTGTLQRTATHFLQTVSFKNLEELSMTQASAVCLKNLAHEASHTFEWADVMELHTELVLQSSRCIWPPGVGEEDERLRVRFVQDRSIEVEGQAAAPTADIDYDAEGNPVHVTDAKDYLFRDARLCFLTFQEYKMQYKRVKWTAAVEGKEEEALSAATPVKGAHVIAALLATAEHPAHVAHATPLNAASLCPTQPRTAVPRTARQRPRARPYVARTMHAAPAAAAVPKCRTPAPQPHCHTACRS